MKKLLQILMERKKREVQRNLNEAEDMTQRWRGFLPRVPETPPQLEGSRILLLMISTPRCLYAALYALYLSIQLNSELYVLHKGILAPYIVEQAMELQVSIPVAHQIEHVRLEEIQHLVQQHAIDLIVTSSGIPNARELLNRLQIPILFTKGSYGP